MTRWPSFGVVGAWRIGALWGLEHGIQCWREKHRWLCCVDIHRRTTVWDDPTKGSGSAERRRRSECYRCSWRSVLSLRGMRDSWVQAPGGYRSRVSA